MKRSSVELKIQSYSKIVESPYGNYKSSDESIRVANEIVHLVGDQYLPNTVCADGVILKYPHNINVEVSDDGSILILDGYNNDFEPANISACAQKIKSLLEVR